MPRSRFFADTNPEASILDLSLDAFGGEENTLFEKFEGKCTGKEYQRQKSMKKTFVVDSSDDEEQTTQEGSQHLESKSSSSLGSEGAKKRQKKKTVESDSASDSEESIVAPKRLRKTNATDDKEEKEEKNDVIEVDSDDSEEVLPTSKRGRLKKTAKSTSSKYDLDMVMSSFKDEVVKDGAIHIGTTPKKRKTTGLKQKSKSAVVESSEEEESASEDSDSNSGNDYSDDENEDAVGELFERCEKISDNLLAHVNTHSIDSKTFVLEEPGIATSASREAKGNSVVVSRTEADKLFPDGLALKEYQLVGLNWLQVLYNQELNGILADEMGLGKTVQAIAILAWLKATKGINGPHLIVAPGSTLENWRRELERWVPEHRVVLFHGSQSERAEIMNKNPPKSKSRPPLDILLTTYTYFERDSCNADRAYIGKFKFHYIVTDEAHGIKNMNSSRYKRLNRVRSQRRLLLSGTPVQNNLEELLALMSFCMPQVFDASSEQLNGYFRNVGEQETERIRRALKPFVLRRLKADVLGQLSPKVESVRLLDQTPQQKELYDTIVSDYRSKRYGGGKFTNKGFIHFFSELRKAANHPLLVRNWFGKSAAESSDGVDRSMETVARLLFGVNAFGPTATVDMIQNEIKSYSDWDLHLLAANHGSSSSQLRQMKLPDNLLWTSAKGKELQTLLPKLIAGGHRFLIFSQWTTILDLIQEMLLALDISYVRFDGQTVVGDRQEIIDRYNTDRSIHACLLSTRAGGMGINLTSADTVILHDLDFNPSLDRQAEDRCHRIGQTKTVTVYKLVAKDTVDEKILNIQIKKKQLDESILSSNGATPVKKGGKRDPASDPIKLIMEQL